MDKPLPKILNVAIARKTLCAEEENRGKVKAEIPLEDSVLPRALFEVASL